MAMAPTTRVALAPMALALAGHASETVAFRFPPLPRAIYPVDITLGALPPEGNDVQLPARADDLGGIRRY